MLPEIQELVASNGNVRLAAERLHISPIELTKVLLENRDDLAAAVQTSLLLQLLDITSNFRVALIASLDDLSGRETIRGYAGLLDAVQGMLNPAQPTGGLMQLINGDVAELPFRVRLDSASADRAGALR